MEMPWIDLSEYPDLARPFRWKWGPIDGRFELLGQTAEMPNDGLISNVRIVPFIGDGDEVLVLKMADGDWDHPGGTREPDEPIIETARRELLEEAGAKLISLEPFGLFNCHSLQEKPYRPHMPFPHFYHLVAFAEVERVGDPENPDGELATLEVCEVSLDEAASRFTTRRDGGLWMADMYRLGARVRRLMRESRRE